jgi:hypothetical protein
VPRIGRNPQLADLHMSRMVFGATFDERKGIRDFSVVYAGTAKAKIRIKKIGVTKKRRCEQKRMHAYTIV